jgi:hypothetical protein
MNGDTQSGLIFWVKESHVASPHAPDDVVYRGGKPELSLILRPGDAHWAYAHGLKNDDPPATPLLFDPYRPGTDEFDSKLWEGKAVLLRIDGSARADRLDPKDHKLRDSDGLDLFDPAARHWDLHPPDLRQPEPAK